MCLFGQGRFSFMAARTVVTGIAPSAAFITPCCICGILFLQTLPLRQCRERTPPLPPQQPPPRAPSQVRCFHQRAQFCFPKSQWETLQYVDSLEMRGFPPTPAIFHGKPAEADYFLSSGEIIYSHQNQGSTPKLSPRVFDVPINGRIQSFRGLWTFFRIGDV